MEEKIRYEVKEMSTDGEKISNLFASHFKEHALKVNRKYQRKLVWSLQEKKDFIDSLLNGYPVPLFIFARTPDSDGEREIVDGLQRLDALFSFIKNEFKVKWEGKECYFNAQALNYFSFEIEQKEPKMDAVFCRNFGEKELPTTTVTIKDDKVIEKIFKRLNSTGRRLSAQDLRQAGAFGDFSDLVRKTAAEIRGDKSNSDVLDLSEMQQISLNSKGLNYGIKMRDLFWCKHGIISQKEIRASRDEELLAQIYGYLLTGDTCGANSTVLDSMYDSKSRKYPQFEKAIQSRGQLVWMSDFISVQNQIVRVLDASGKTFTNLLFTKRKISGKSKIYSALFLAIWELKKDGKELGDPIKISKILSKLGDNDVFRPVTEESHWNRDLRNSCIAFFKEKLESAAIVVEGSHFSQVPATLANALNEASKVRTENSLLEFKFGLHGIESKTYNRKIVKDVVKTYTAVNNLKKDGFIVIGIANDVETAKEFKNSWGDNFVGYGGCFVTGLDAEIKQFWENNTDKFSQKIREEVNKCNVNSLIKKRILENSKFIEYCGKLIFVIECKWCGELYKFNGKIYTRHGSSTDEVDLTTEEYFEMLKGSDGKMIRVV